LSKRRLWISSPGKLRAIEMANRIIWPPCNIRFHFSQPFLEARTCVSEDTCAIAARDLVAWLESEVFVIGDGRFGKAGSLFKGPRKRE
jgi:hypothetical protein